MSPRVDPSPAPARLPRRLLLRAARLHPPGRRRTALADPAVYALDGLKKPQRAALVRFWEAWQDELAGIRLLDPACGSGAFLIEAFDQLHAAYQASNDRLMPDSRRQAKTVSALTCSNWPAFANAWIPRHSSPFAQKSSRP